MKAISIAVLLCVAAAVAETLLAGRDPASTLRQVRQPRWAPPRWVWVVIGVGYYACSGFSLWRLLRIGTPGSTLPLALLLSVMVANAAWNYLFFRRRGRHYWMAFVLGYYLPYGVLVAALLWSLARVDRPALLAMSVYAAYLPYAAAIGYRWWKDNPDSMAH